MPFCTTVEFEWSDEAERGRFQGAADAGNSVADGRIARIVGIDDAGARVVIFEVTS